MTASPAVADPTLSASGGVARRQTKTAPSSEAVTRYRSSSLIAKAVIASAWPLKGSPDSVMPAGLLVSQNRTTRSAPPVTSNPLTSENATALS
jgi:hypothetical protein